MIPKSFLCVNTGQKTETRNNEQSVQGVWENAKMSGNG